jgi:hypothetical protein
VLTGEDALAAGEVCKSAYELLVQPMLTALGLYILEDGIISRTSYRTVKDSNGYRVLNQSIVIKAPLRG